MGARNRGGGAGHSLHSWVACLHGLLPFSSVQWSGGGGRAPSLRGTAPGLLAKANNASTAQLTLSCCFLPTATEVLVDLPLAYFLPPNATTPGQLPMELDFEQQRCALCALLFPLFHWFFLL